jgi:hypothetical protein
MRKAVIADAQYGADETINPIFSSANRPHDHGAPKGAPFDGVLVMPCQTSPSLRAQ